MKIEILKQSDAAEVKLTGSLKFDANRDFKGMIQTLSSYSISSCNLDFSGLEHVDSAGISMLFLLREDLAKRNVVLSISGAEGHVADMLNIVNLSKILANDAATMHSGNA